MKTKLSLIVFVILSLFCSCKTVQTPVVLPKFKPMMPTRPILETVNEDVPIEAERNLIKLMSYSKQLEMICESWGEFYSSLQTGGTSK